MTDNVRSRLGSTSEIGELKRDVDDALAARVPSAVVEMTDLYTEPMYVRFDHEPKGVLAIRVRADAALETPVAGSSFVAFTWDGSRIRIDDIPGLTAGTKYRFAFLMVG